MRQKEVLHLLDIAMCKKRFKVKKVLFRQLEDAMLFYEETMMTGKGLGISIYQLRIC